MEGVCLLGRGVSVSESLSRDSLSRESVSRGSLSEGVCPGGPVSRRVCVQGSVSGGCLNGDPPPVWPVQQSVRIILESILVPI